MKIRKTGSSKNVVSFLERLWAENGGQAYVTNRNTRKVLIKAIVETMS